MEIKAQCQNCCSNTWVEVTSDWMLKLYECKECGTVYSLQKGSKFSSGTNRAALLLATLVSLGAFFMGKSEILIGSVWSFCLFVLLGTTMIDFRVKYHLVEHKQT